MEQSKSNDPTKQALKTKAGKGGIVPPVDRQFGKPGGNKRHSGAWKKEDTARFKLEQMMKMSDSELKRLAGDKKAPLFERRLAQCINRGDWLTIQGMINQVYGKPTERIEHKVVEPKPILDLTTKKK